MNRKTEIFLGGHSGLVWRLFGFACNLFGVAVLYAALIFERLNPPAAAAETPGATTDGR